MNGRVQASLTVYSLERMEMVAQGVVKLPRPRRIRFTIEHKSESRRNMSEYKLVLLTYISLNPPTDTLTALLRTINNI